jgi:hypothetical protein
MSGEPLVLIALARRPSLPVLDIPAPSLEPRGAINRGGRLRVGQELNGHGRTR